MSVPPLPRLLPQNRKVRHLRGIYLRKLDFTPPREQAIDDAAINKSSTKLSSVQDGKQLHHAQSSEALRPGKLRRRSTNLANADPITRQKMLQLEFESKSADAFFSLHCGDDQDPVYISELREKSANFNFQFFDLASLNPDITRSSQITVKVWVKRRDAWSLFIEDKADLRLLNYLQTLPGNRFPPNTIIFHLIDGAYAFGLKNKKVPPKGGEALETSSYNALMKFANLDNSVQDALATQNKLTTEIDRFLTDTPANEVPAAEDKAKLTQKYLANQRRIVGAAKKRRDDLEASIKARRAAIADGRLMQEKANRDVENASEKLPSSIEQIVKTNDDIRGQRRRICEDLINIYTITPATSGQALAFQICGLPLPNTDYTQAFLNTSGGEDAVSAALGHVAIVANALQYYLGVALPYEITPFGSRSTIRDDISMLADSQRDFPLYIPKGGSKAQYRFDYGWFLLNKDIETLCNAQGLKVVDIRHTLPNLKYLLYVCSAGTDELPERKKGGIRGLWAGRMQSRGLSLEAEEGGSSTGGSRRGSADSELLSKQREELKKSLILNGKGGGGGDASTVTSPTLGLPFTEEEMKLTLRTKGLRENIGK